MSKWFKYIAGDVLDGSVQPDSVLDVDYVDRIHFGVSFKDVDWDNVLRYKLSEVQASVKPRITNFVPTPGEWYPVSELNSETMLPWGLERDDVLECDNGSVHCYVSAGSIQDWGAIKRFKLLDIATKHTVETELPKFDIKPGKIYYAKSDEAEAVDPNSRYYDAGGIEVIEIIKAKLTPEQLQGFLLGNIIKYSCRLNFKGSAERDAEKCKFYSQWLSELNDISK